LKLALEGQPPARDKALVDQRPGLVFGMEGRFIHEQLLSELFGLSEANFCLKLPERHKSASFAPKAEFLV
jgi:hypothetical protein